MSSTIENRLNKIKSEFISQPSDIEEIKAVKKKVVVIMGAGNGLGAAIAKEFANHNFITIVCRRNKEKLEPLIQEIKSRGQVCYGYGVDARKEDQVVKLFNDVEKFYGPIDVGIFNIGVNIKYDIKDTSSKAFFKIWEMNTFSGFLFGKELSLKMSKRQKGTIIFTGASASLRGNPGFSAFTSSKSGLRTLAQSMAKELAPQNIHVGHVIVDGGIDSEFMRDMMKEKLSNVKAPVEQQLMQPVNIAKNYWYLYKQPKNCWTFELDLRTYLEKW